MGAFLELKELYKTYGNSSTVSCEGYVLKNINLSIDQGDFVALMGPSGSGKSTLMNILGCMDVPSKGYYGLDGHAVGSLTLDQQARLRNQMIGFIFQNFNLLPRSTLEMNVALPLIYAGHRKSEREKQAKALLEKVGLESKIKSFPNQISGGEQQRVAIARALINHPKLILADEPTGNLDSVTSRSIMSLFSQLNEAGITIFLVTHDPSIAAYAKHVIHIRDGKIYV